MTLDWKDGHAYVKGEGWSAEFALTTQQLDRWELSCDWYLPCSISDYWNNEEEPTEAAALALADVWLRQLIGVAALLKAHEPAFLACEGVDAEAGDGPVSAGMEVE